MSTILESEAERLRKAMFGDVSAAPPEDVAAPIKTKAVPAWPSVLTGDEMYSTRFAEHFDSTKMVDFALPDIPPLPAWAEKYIPTASDFRPPSPMLVYQSVMAYALKSVTHLVGYPGTGKSEGLPVYMAYKLGLPLLRVGLNKKGMGLDDLVGRQSIENDGGTPVTKWADGVLCKWVQIPSIILLDEFARASMEISNGAMSLMEKDGKLLLEDRPDPIVKRHANCWIVASDNVKGTGDVGVGMVGTDQVDGAILDRFTTTIEVGYLSVEDSADLLCRQIVGFPVKAALQLAKFGQRVQKAYIDGKLPISWSHRSMYAVGLQACVMQDLQEAVRIGFFNRFDGDDKATVSSIWRDVAGKEM